MGRRRPTRVLTCFRTRRRIGAYLDGALEGDAEASAARHLAECATCQREAEELGRVKALLQRALAPSAAPPRPDWSGFWPGVLRGIEEARRAPAAAPRRVSARARWALGGALAAALLISATLWQWPAAPPPVAEDPVVVNSADTDHPDGSVMIYHTPERDMAVVWVFGVDE